MIISASRRTDIPNYYSDWFFNRIKEQYVLVRNPINMHWVSKISLLPEIVDCIVFWTKNPAPMLKRLNEIEDYHYYFQFTLNPYGHDVEVNLPSKNDGIIPAFQKLSDQIGPERVIWRYDPILLNEKYSIAYHFEYFNKIAFRLRAYTEKCIISYIDLYKNSAKRLRGLGLYDMTAEKMMHLACGLSKIAKENNLKMETCCENVELEQYGIHHARCIDAKLIERIAGYKIDVAKDKNQRLECGCVSSIDIGMYNTCLNECRYCYANLSKNKISENFGAHNKNKPLLCGELTEKDVVHERETNSLKRLQLDMFDDKIKLNSCGGYKDR